MPDLKGQSLGEACERESTLELDKGIHVMTFAAIFLFAAICFANLPHSVTSVRADAHAREEANRGADSIAQYCRAHPESFYFEDVYSTVGFSQKIFKNVDNSLTNYDIMGGWMCKTPLYEEKLRKFGIPNTQDGLLGGDGVYFIIEVKKEGANLENAEGVGSAGGVGCIVQKGPVDDSADWLVEYYLDKGFNVSLELIDLIDGSYAVYRVKCENVF